MSVYALHEDAMTTTASIGKLPPVTTGRRTPVASNARDVVCLSGTDTFSEEEGCRCQGQQRADVVGQTRCQVLTMLERPYIAEPVDSQAECRETRCAELLRIEH